MKLSSDIAWLIFLALVTTVLFVNAAGGEFVYDDKRQVAGNALIQDPALYGKALSNDVWAFKGDGTISASNYWRPTFTAWCIVNFRLFGLNPVGWHVTNILLQIGVCCLGFLLLRKWGLSQLTAGAIVLIYAVHPSHSESVAWIAGSPDLLFGVFFLASLWFAEAVNDPEKKLSRTRNLAIAIVCYLLAMGAKEVAFLCFPLYFLIFWNAPVVEVPKQKKKAVKVSAVKRVNRSVMFAAAAVAYFCVRLLILGQLSRPAEGAAGFKSAIITAPAIFVFYLKQIVFPYWVGINYALRPMEQIGLREFFLPLIISACAVVLLWKLGQRSRVQTIGLALFALPLLPVFNITAFLPEQIVHDRYLYLPLFGFLMVVIPSLRELFERLAPGKADRLLLAFSVLVSIPLAVQTFRINRTWVTELALWQHAVTIDPRSASNWSALGSELSEEDRIDEALQAYNTSLEIRPSSSLARIGRAQNLIKSGRLNEGAQDLQAVTATQMDKIDIYTLYQAFEGLAIAYQQGNQLDKAEATLKDARVRLPIYRAAFTSQLAIILYGENRKQEALTELEGARAQAAVELLPASKAVFLRLGMLYAEQGRTEDAKANLQEYLRSTETTKDKETAAERAQATQILKGLH